MAKDTTIEATFFEKLTDALSGFSEGVAGFLLRLLGSSNERYIRSLGYIRSKDPKATHTVVPGSLLDQVNRLEEKMLALRTTSSRP
jgi:preprotein translocase subunit SecA